MAFTQPGSLPYEVEYTLRTIFRRACLECPDVTPSCPTCKDNEICSLVPKNCTACASMICVKNPSASDKSSGPNVGAIAGGVVGGIAFVAIIVFLIWRFWIRKRRAQQEAEAEEWEEDEVAQQKAIHQFHEDAASVRTRGSLANSLLSRASNIIQIAYIPGVTNRNGSSHNSIFSASPVPPVPAAPGPMPRSPLSNQGDALFFRPGDLRDSTYSATSSLGDRRDTQYTRQSITPSLARASMASAIEPPMPATQALRAAPRMVSVKSSAASSPNESPDSATPTSTQDHSQFAANTPGAKGKQIQVVMPGQGDRSDTSGSLRSNGSFGKAQQITLGNKIKGRFPVRQTSDNSLATSKSRHAPAVSSPLAEANSDEDEDEHARARQSIMNGLMGSTSPPTSQPVESPFFDPSERPSAAVQAAVNSRPNPYASMSSSVGSGQDEKHQRSKRSLGGLSAVIEEATRRASRVPSHDGLAGKTDASPFSDTHELR